MEIRIKCENTNTEVLVKAGTTLKELAEQIVGDLPILAALVDNKLNSLDYKIINPHNVKFIGYDHPEGRRSYVRSLCFVLQNVVRTLYPNNILAIDYALPSGLYCEIREKEHAEDGRPVAIALTDEDLSKIEAGMRELVARDLPFTKQMLSLEECCEHFSRNNQTEKVNLLKTLGRFNYNVYFLDDQADTFYGPLVPSTGALKTFNISRFRDGLCLQFPMDGNQDRQGSQGAL